MVFSLLREENIDQYLSFLSVRESIRILKQLGFNYYPKHSFCEVISKYRFCNVFREDDKVTIWIDQNIRKKFKDEKYLWFAYPMFDAFLAYKKKDKKKALEIIDRVKASDINLACKLWLSRRKY